MKAAKNQVWKKSTDVNKAWEYSVYKAQPHTGPPM